MTRNSMRKRMGKFHPKTFSMLALYLDAYSSKELTSAPSSTVNVPQRRFKNSVMSMAGKRYSGKTETRGPVQISPHAMRKNPRALAKMTAQLSAKLAGRRPVVVNWPKNSSRRRIRSDRKTHIWKVTNRMNVFQHKRSAGCEAG